MQELIALSDLSFFSQNWVEIGKKSDLHDLLSKITGIDADFLTGVRDLGSASVAKRFSWASRRTTTRDEDVAYCLMGLFGVNMALLYGERERAFIRLQEEIMKHSDDQSIFAWTLPTAAPGSHCGLLAQSPANFVNAGAIVPYRDWQTSRPFSMSNKGLRIDVPLVRHAENIYIAALDCPAPPNDEGPLGIYLQRVLTGDHQYARVRPESLCKVLVRGDIETVYVRQRVLSSGLLDDYPRRNPQIGNRPAPDDIYQLVSSVHALSSQLALPVPIFPFQPPEWTQTGVPFNFMVTRGPSRLLAALLLERLSNKTRVLIMFGCTPESEPTFDVAVISEIKNFTQVERLFNPRKTGTYMAVEHHRVRVDAEEQKHEGAGVYMVTVVVEGTELPSNAVEVIPCKL